MLNKKINSPSQNDIKKAINKKIDGKLFSDRIWDNKDKLLKKVKRLINDVLNGKMTIDEAGDYIKKVFGSSAKDSYRLMITEVMRAQAQASIEAAKRLGVKRHMWNAKFENTCERCKKRHGKKFDIDDKNAPEIPLHPYCKCIWVNILNQSRGV
jgi:SPP1 gp7 family putative phage head morphogenesis protein